MLFFPRKVEQILALNTQIQTHEQETRGIQEVLPLIHWLPTAHPSTPLDSRHRTTSIGCFRFSSKTCLSAGAWVKPLFFLILWFYPENLFIRTKRELQESSQYAHMKMESSGNRYTYIPFPCFWITEILLTVSKGTQRSDTYNGCLFYSAGAQKYHQRKGRSCPSMQSYDYLLLLLLLTVIFRRLGSWPKNLCKVIKTRRTSGLHYRMPFRYAPLRSYAIWLKHLVTGRKCSSTRVSGTSSLSTRGSIGQLPSLESQWNLNAFHIGTRFSQKRKERAGSGERERLFSDVVYQLRVSRLENRCGLDYVLHLNVRYVRICSTMRLRKS